MNNPQQSPLDARNEELEKELALKNRELEVEAALERVRARAMAMYNSDELNDVLAVLIEQFDILGIHPVKAVLCLFDEEKNTFTFRTTGRAGQRIIGEQIFAIDSNDVFKEIFETWKNSAPHSVFCNYISSKDLPQVWNLFPNTFANMPEEASVYPKDYPDGLYNIFGYCKFGFIGFDHTRAATESEKKIVVRFANEFERLYQRFLDLQKAEAQAREAQIETALERVRSRSMGMHKSEELREVIQLVFEQLLHLNIKADAAMFDLDFRESNDFNLWVAVPGSSYPRMQHIPYFDQLVFNTIRDAKASGLDFCVEQYSLEEKNQFFEHFFQHVTFVPEERKNFIFSSPGMSRSTLLLKSIGLSMLNYEGIPYTEAENDIFKRLGNVFEQSYTRFLDLQKAEAQEEKQR